MLTLNRLSSVPVYEQIISGIERDILLGAIKANDRLPSVRDLASMLDTNPNTVQKAYAELNARNIIVSIQSSGAYVSEKAIEKIKEHKLTLLAKINEISYELCSAGIDLNSVTEQVRSAYSAQQSQSDSSADGISLLSGSSVRKSDIPKRDVAKKEPKTPKKQNNDASVPQTTRKRNLGVELL